MNVRDFIIGQMCMRPERHRLATELVLTCGSPEVLRVLADAVQSTNRLTYNFEDVSGLSYCKTEGSTIAVEPKR